MLFWLRKLLFRTGLKVWSGPWFPNVYCMLHTVWLPRALYVITSLEIPDLLKERPRTAKELAEATSTDEKSLFHLLRLLAAYDVVSMDKSGVFRVGKHGRELLKDNPNTTRWWVLSMGNELWDSHGEALDATRTGKTGFELAHGDVPWSWYAEHPEYHEITIEGMNNFTDVHCRALVPAYDFGRFRKLVDVGGGRGSLIMHILQANPKLQGVLFDQPSTVEEALPRIAANGLADRLAGVGGSFFEELPAGADCYTIKHVLRDWPDEKAVSILKNVHAAMPDDGTLLVIDAVVDPRNGKDKLLKMLDVQIKFDWGGGLRTRAEFEEFFRQSGFKLKRVIPTTIIDAHILECRKV